MARKANQSPNTCLLLIPVIIPPYRTSTLTMIGSPRLYAPAKF